ncbi:DUF6377 domain-containing protein [Sphingobacterium detergens]|uniref:DUF6377 domain-containing protein n=1 Tax=Sphingobacterium detergens TaxID=1145106 RepID=A0A420BH46_SPHD1|nr:DUF6377 domain-containing protein [Sphingobacterium detergens]RKE55985.1 hypothetical protein DFQ12_0834 [Sphingobacterium detergens]
MRKPVFIYLILFFIATISKANTIVLTDSLILNLTHLIKNKDTFVEQKELYLSQIKKKLDNSADNLNLKFELQKQLSSSYASYKSDSAIYYAKKNLDLANRLQHPNWILETELDLSLHYLVAGMYIDSKDILDRIPVQKLNNHLKVKYLDAQKNLFKFYAYHNYNQKNYLAISHTYRDSLLTMLDKASNHYKMVYAEKLIDLDKIKEAKVILNSIYETIKEDSHEKAMLAFAISEIYRKEGNVGKQGEFLIISAGCDIKNAIKENTSMQALAFLLHQKGYIDESYICIKSSLEDAIFCNAKFRTYEVSQIFPIIDASYQEHQKQKKEQLFTFLIVASVLSILLILAIIYVYKQMRKVSRFRLELFKANQDLNKLNDELQTKNQEYKIVNQKLSKTNNLLYESNQIKEVYIGHFLDICSMYITKLEKFQTLIKKMIMGDKISELLNLVKSNERIDKEKKELFNTFDHIFLHLFPSFVDDFNALLTEDGKIMLKTNELLNTELRIFALIRLGVNDSSKIAGFLHCSLNTIYTYRAKIKSKAIIDKDEFDKNIMQIGTIKSI